VHANLDGPGTFCMSALFEQVHFISQPEWILQSEWVSLPQPNIPGSARVNFFNLDGDNFKDAANLIKLCLDGLILLDCDKLLQMYLEENKLFQNENRYLFQKCCGLERVSIMHLGRTYLDNEEDLDFFGDNEDNDDE
jgi:hypothetical protein